MWRTSKIHIELDWKEAGTQDKKTIHVRVLWRGEHGNLHQLERNSPGLGGWATGRLSYREARRYRQRAERQLWWKALNGKHLPQGRSVIFPIPGSLYLGFHQLSLEDFHHHPPEQNPTILLNINHICQLCLKGGCDGRLQTFSLALQ